MSIWKRTLILSSIIAIIVGIAIFTSCERNVCDNVSCFNGGSCSGGVCSCPLGYEGPQCGTLSVTRYLGTYMGYTTCNNGPELYDTAIISANPTSINSVYVALSSLKPKVITGYVNSNVSTYSVVVTNNDSLSTDSVVNDRTFTITLQSDVSLSIHTYSIFENSVDTTIEQCSFLGQKL